jgi:hypothetical protein
MPRLIVAFVITAVTGFPDAVFGTVPSAATNETTIETMYVLAAEINDCAREKSPTRSRLILVPFGSAPAGTLTETLLSVLEPENDVAMALDALRVPIRVNADGAIPESES